MKEQMLRRELLVIGLLTVLFLLALVLVLPQDQIISANMRSLSDPTLGAFLTAVSFFGGAPVEATLVALACLLFGWRRRWPEVWFLLATTTTGGALGGIVRLIVRRARPTPNVGAGVLFQLIGRYSFPSGHALFYTTFFGALAYLLWARGSGRWRWAAAPCLAIIVLVGPSRVFLGAHWPSDVVAGYLLGGLAVSGWILFYQWRRGW